MSTNGTPAPSGNGSAAAQAPAPGVAASTPTPKNGEGAVVTPQKTSAEAPKWQPIKRTLKLNDGSTKEYVFNSEEELDRHLFNSHGFDKKSKEAVAAQRELDRVSKLASESPEEFLKHFKHDPKQLAKKWAQEELRRLEMTEEQRAADDVKRENARLKAEAQAVQRQLQQFLQKQQLDAQWKEVEPLWAEGLKKRNRLGDEAYIELCTEIGERYESADIALTPEQVMGLADEQDARNAEAYVAKTPVARQAEALAARVQPEEVAGVLKSLGPKLTPEAVWEALSTPEQRRAVMTLGIAWHKGLKGTQTGTQPPAPAKPAEPRRLLSEAEWRAQRK